jgi:hypothetical protein
MIFSVCLVQLGSGGIGNPHQPRPKRRVRQLSSQASSFGWWQPKNRVIDGAFVYVLVFCGHPSTLHPWVAGVVPAVVTRNRYNELGG